MNQCERSNSDFSFIDFTWNESKNGFIFEKAYSIIFTGDILEAFKNVQNKIFRSSNM